ncbi:MAG: hypothetical protein GY906_12915 [bacterium]|nr:hypothetical protein [bacterium]
MRISLDTETDLMGAGNVIPNLICATTATRLDSGAYETGILGNGDDNLFPMLEWLLTDDDIELVFHNAAFDLTVICKKYPQLFPAVFTALEKGRVFDTQIREKLLNLSTTGDLKFITAPDGTNRRLNYKLMTLETKYIGIERGHQKEGEDIWRLNFKDLDGLPASEYPEDAAEYAIADAVGTLQVFEAQEQRCDGATAGPGSMATQEYQAGADFALMLMTGWGMMTDPEEKAKIEAMLARELAPDKLNLLVESGILRPGTPPAPYKNKAKNKDGTLKLTKGTKESINKKKLGELVVDVCKQHGLDFKPTDSTKGHENPKPSTDAEVMMDLAPKNATLAQYQHRQKLQKLVTTELPRMGNGGTVHPQFDVLKETSRTSSYASDLYPSLNIQNIDYRVRNCFVAREGKVLLSCDYASLELVTLAQKLYNLFGQSRLMDLINDGVDAHAFLGSALAYNLHEDFRETCGEEGVQSEMDVYKVFLNCKNSPSEDVRAFFKHWRTFAKPTGLGFPGGLGPATFVTYAKATFNVTCTEEMAHQLRNIWHATYPEMKPYFEWINTHCEDPNNPEAYAYNTPLGAYRAGASYCAAANGAALQSPAAEGGKVATFEVQRGCYDKTMESCLYGCRGLGFIHDELLMELPRDNFMHERACEVERIMVQSMSSIVTDVRVKAEPALMLRWDKRADQVFKDGRLTIWTPEQ